MSNVDIEKFLSGLPAGIKEQTRWMQDLGDGLLYPNVAIRFWDEMATMTDDGQPISSSGSHWSVAAWVSGRGFVAEALTAMTGKHYEVWSLSKHKQPRIIDYTPDLTKNLHGKLGRYTEIEEQDIREYARTYTLDYYGIHPSNERFVEIVACGHHNDHHANWACTVNFSAKGDQVTLLIHSSVRGLEVFAHEYKE